MKTQNKNHFGGVSKNRIHRQYEMYCQHILAFKLFLPSSVHPSFFYTANGSMQF